MELVKKVTLKELNATKFAAMAVAENRIIELGAIVGMVTGVKASKKANDDGSVTIQLNGEFYGKNADGLEVSGSSCILPSVVHESVLNALANREDGDGGIEFAFNINVKPTPERSIKFQYGVQTLTKIAPSKPLARLMALIPGNEQAQIAAPGAPVAPAPVQSSGPNGPDGKTTPAPVKEKELVGAKK